MPDPTLPPDDDDILLRHRLNQNAEFYITRTLAQAIASYCQQSPVSGIVTFGANLASLANLP